MPLLKALLTLPNNCWPRVLGSVLIHFYAGLENVFQRIIVVMWSVAFVCGFIPMMLVMDIHDRDRSLPISYSHWSHCSADPSR